MNQIIIKKNLQEYFSIKNALQLPIKVKMYFSILQALTFQQNEDNIPKEYLKSFQFLLKSFQNQTKQQKTYFLKCSIEFVKDYLHQNNYHTPQHQIINNIQTSCKYAESFLGITTWIPVNFILNKQIFKIYIKTKKKQFIIDLNFFFIRLSRKVKNTIVFEGYSTQNNNSTQKHVFEFGDNICFLKIYENIRQLILQFFNKQLLSLLQQNNKNNQKINNYINQVYQTLLILNSKTVNQYFQEKDNQIKQLLNGKAKFQLFAKTNAGMMLIGLDNQHLFRFQKIYPFSLAEVSQRLVLFKRQPKGFLLHYQTIQQFSQNIELGYFKCLINSNVYEFLTIVEDNPKQNELTTMFKGIKNITVSKLIDFLSVKALKINNQQTKIIITGLINISTDQSINTKFFYQIAQSIYCQKQVNNIQDEDSFYSVRGQFTEDHKQQCYFNQLDLMGYLQPTFAIADNYQSIEVQQAEDQISIENLNESKFGKTIQSSSEQINSPYKYALKPKIKSNQQIIIQKHFLWVQYIRGPNGGVICINQAIVSQQKKVLKRILGQIGENLLSFKNVMNVSLPVQIFRKESLLRVIAGNLCYAPMLLQNILNETPLMRLKKAVLFLISMQILGISMEKPFNPILGQTYQGFIDECPIFLQQISHHPPISAYHFTGRGYKIYGCVELKATLGLNTAKGHNQRSNFIVFDDGQIIEFKQTTLIIKGIFFGEREFNFEGKGFVIDRKNGLFAQVCYGDRNYSFWSRSKCFSDQVSGQIYKLTKQFVKLSKTSQKTQYPTKNDFSQTLCTFSGIWNQQVKFDSGEKINFTTELPFKLIDEDYPLNSDCRNRTDVIELQQGHTQQSQLEKQRLEQIQRAQKKLRQKNKIFKK